MDTPRRRSKIIPKTHQTVSQETTPDVCKALVAQGHQHARPSTKRQSGEKVAFLRHWYYELRLLYNMRLSCTSLKFIILNSTHNRTTSFSTNSKAYQLKNKTSSTTDLSTFKMQPQTIVYLAAFLAIQAKALPTAGGATVARATGNEEWKFDSSSKAVQARADEHEDWKFDSSSKAVQARADEHEDWKFDSSSKAVQARAPKPEDWRFLTTGNAVPVAAN
ncbi:hypothetical protein NLG97_g2016 [Lecanicillium saksenae]|uniref:Uncharacterized protein n=1 Tax=Lecanicillium saksenae TaxID=468837 RepID=A0ACC1R5D5_9HYPO|nr:hypothetical protein NLG97_g2016 [Lecanicillium saksenae]